MRKQQHTSAREVNLKNGDIIMAKLCVPLAESNKLSPKFSGPHKIIARDIGNKFKIQHLRNGEVTIQHFNDLEKAKLSDQNTVFIKESENITENSPENSEDAEN